MGIIDLKGKKILVVGGNGYLGQFLVKALKENKADVFVISRKTNWLYLGNRDPRFQVYVLFSRWPMEYVSIKNRSFCSRGRGRKGWI